MKPLIAPSILAADFGRLKEEVEMLNESAADWIHVDVMDGVFVPNISFGFPVIEQIKKYAKKPLDVHLMIVNPDNYIAEFKKVGADILTVHYEACTHLHRTLQVINAEGMKPGVVINPHTPVSVLEDILHDVYLILVMSVNPGFGGQKFIKHTIGKVTKLKAMLLEADSTALIEVDGGVNTDNASALLRAGADALVVGSFVFRSNNPKQTIIDLKNAGSVVV